MGICNSFATVAGIVSPLLTGYIVTTPVSFLLSLQLNHFVNFCAFRAMANGKLSSS